MNDRNLKNERDVERVLGLDTDHVTERQTGETVDPGDETTARTDGEASSADEAAQAALIDAGGRVVGVHVPGHKDGPEIEGPNST
jgi:hypothetical protein